MAASAGGLTAFYLVNNDNISPDKRPHHALSLFSSDMDFNDCLTNTITEENELKSKPDLMRHKMEAFVTNLQGRVIKRLQKFEPETEFVVDRWLRKEVVISQF